MEHGSDGNFVSHGTKTMDGDQTLNNTEYGFYGVQPRHTFSIRGRDLALIEGTRYGLTKMLRLNQLSENLVVTMTLFVNEM